MCEEDGNVVFDDDLIWGDELNWNGSFLDGVGELSKEFFDKVEDGSRGEESSVFEEVSVDYGSSI